MIESGYRYVPTQLAGWTKTDSDAKVNDAVENKIEKCLSGPGGRRDVSPGEVLGAHRELRDAAQSAKGVFRKGYTPASRRYKAGQALKAGGKVAAKTVLPAGILAGSAYGGKKAYDK